jgi:NAD(P)-dependent dehydrogenase (short-subunit alcohol dehydrogenase family)
MEGGTIIKIASICGIRAGYRPHAYTAAKCGVIGLTKSVALELAERGIRVNVVCPGGIATEIWAPPEMPAELGERTPEIVEPWPAGTNPMGRSGFPFDIANAVLWLASNESTFVTGHALVVDDGSTAGIHWAQQLKEFDQLGKRFRSALGQTTVTA